MTDIRPLGAKTVVAMLDLKVKPHQDHLVAPNDVTLAQALFEGGSAIFGIYDTETPVGLMALIDLGHPEATPLAGETPQDLYVWRLLIDAPHQGRGHGAAALAFAKTHARTLGRTRVTLTIAPTADAAVSFYEKSGFTKTGLIIDAEPQMACHLKKD